jgi:NAD(P)H-flavin reductase
MAVFQEMSWHMGEKEIQAAMHVEDIDNPTVPQLSPQLSNHLQIAPLISVGTLDKDGRPWTTLLGGETPLSQPLGGGIIGLRTPVIARYDPVVEALVGGEAKGEVVREEGKGRMISGLTIDLQSRKRVKLFGRMIAGALSKKDDGEAAVVEMQVVLKVEQSLGNCPKYLNKKKIEPAISNPRLVSDSTRLSPQAVELIAKADLFFISSSNQDQDMDTNHRGGPTGFIRVSQDASTTVLYWPEYSGNRLYQTLGNLQINPVAGICIPDFDTGDMLFLTGTTQVLMHEHAAAVLPRSNLCVRLTITAARFVSQALPFRGHRGEPSPYNPPIRPLASEKNPPASSSSPSSSPSPSPQQHATLLTHTPLTPTISRFRFALETAPAAAALRPGQSVTLDFSPHLAIGYQHMCDADPRSLNDDFLRTFTVSSSSSPPPRSELESAPAPTAAAFEITARNVGGAATRFLFSRAAGRERTGGTVEVGVRGFGGEFEVRQGEGDGVVGFVAGGVGITPLLPALGTLELERLRVWWTLRREDLGLVRDVVGRYPGLGPGWTVFVTRAEGGADGGGVEVEELENKGVTVHWRRMEREDLDLDVHVERYYVCTPLGLRKQLQEWLPEKEVIFEEFDF